MKVFVAGGSSGMSAILDQLVMIICVVVTASLFSVDMHLLRTLIVSETTTVTSSSPHMTYLLGAYAALLQAIGDMFAMFWFDTPFANVDFDKRALVDHFEWLLERYNRWYVNVRFGNMTTELPPYPGYAQGSRDASDSIACTNKYKIPFSLSEATDCFAPDMVYGCMEAILEARVSVFKENSDQVSLADPTRTQTLFSLMVYPIYELLVYPMFDVIDGTVRQELSSGRSEMHPAMISLLVVAVIFECAAILQMLGMQAHMHRVLRLLLHCPPWVVLQTSKVMTILSGDFANRRRDESAKTAAFFRQVVMQMPDAILTIDASTFIVTSQNTAAERIFSASMIGVDIGEHLRSSQWSGPVAHILAVSGDSKPVTETLVYQKDETTSVNLETTVHTIQDSYVYVIRDVTATVRYNALIAVERAKSEQMLKSILPPSLVPRVEAGEKNISFAVASASIVFMDIVSFTPWCGSSTAERVMMTLNALFKKFDSNCARQSTMTRIKCIGDCYVAAGGVFSEMNQPTEHAKQVVQFGLDSIYSVHELNAELNEHLQIRVGVNTGGPIVAGVIGGGPAKPTFEILGPSINVAQQMEHHGVPMQVHISRFVYELIYGDQFIVKERGTPIEVKGVAVVTYLVSEKNARPLPPGAIREM
jgi:class 3 adenylate cyclase